MFGSLHFGHVAARCHTPKIRLGMHRQVTSVQSLESVYFAFMRSERGLNLIQIELMFHGEC